MNKNIIKESEDLEYRQEITEMGWFFTFILIILIILYFYFESRGI